MPRIDATAKVTGSALYPGDLSMPGMLYAKELFARHPHARLLTLDLHDALAIPGVVAIYTGADVPLNEYGLGHFDAPVLVTPQDRLASMLAPRPFDGVVRHEGEKVALIVAESEEIAAQSRAAIRATYEDLPVISSVQQAIDEHALQVHPDYAGNVMHSYRIRKGDVQAGFAAADVIVEDTYFTGAQEHAYLQPEAGLAYIDAEGRVTVQVAGQWAHEDQEQIAHALCLPLEQVRVIYPAIGVGLRRARGYERADCAGAGSAQATQACEDHLDARREHHRASQASPNVFPCQTGREARWHAGGGAGGCAGRCRTLCLYQPQGVG